MKMADNVDANQRSGDLSVVQCKKKSQEVHCHNTFAMLIHILLNLEKNCGKHQSTEFRMDPKNCIMSRFDTTNLIILYIWSLHTGWFVI